MVLLLDVPYPEKDDAKAKGAKWNPNLKSWYIDDITKMSHVDKWAADYNILCSKLYVFEMDINCWKCRKSTIVACLASDDCYNPENKYCENKDLQLFSYLTSLPLPLQDYLKTKYNCFPTFSKQFNETYYMNHCSHCGSVQGDYFLHERPEQAFYKKLFYMNSTPSTYTTIENKYIVPLVASLPYYDEMCHSQELMLHHMETEIENRSSLLVSQKKINGLFDKSIHLGTITISGI